MILFYAEIQATIFHINFRFDTSTRSRDKRLLTLSLSKGSVPIFLEEEEETNVISSIHINKIEQYFCFR